MKQPDLDEDFSQEMKRLVILSRSDPELSHAEADKLLIALLKLGGFDKTIYQYNKVKKYY